MKKINLYCMAVVSVLVLLTSCLGDSGNSTQQSYGQFAVARMDSKSFKTVLDVYGYGPLYSPAAELQVSAGSCYSIDYQIDLSSPENANAATNGYLVAAISNIHELDKGSAIPQIADTTALIENEQTIDELYMMIGGYINGYLLVGTKSKQLKKQQTDFSLYYDMSQKVKENSNGERYYDVFIRAVKKVEGEGTTPSETVDYRVYELKRFIDHFLEQEKAANKKQVNFKFNYLKSINEKDSTDLKWEYFLAPFAVPSSTGN